MQKEFRSLIKSIVIYGFGNVSIKLIGLILLPMYTNTKLLSVDEYGAMGILDISAQVLISIFSLSLASAYLRWYWDKSYISRRKTIFFTCFATLSILAIFLAGSGWVTAGAVTTTLWGNKTFANAFALMAVASSMQPLIDFTLTQMRAENKASFFVSANISRLALSLFATIFLLKYAGHGISGIYEAQIIGNIAFLLLTSKYIIKNIEFEFSFPVLKEILKFSMPLALASLSNVLLVVFDRYVLNYKSTLLNVGIYTQGYKIANTTKVFVINSVQLALAPAVFKIMNRPDCKEIYSKIMTWFTIIVVYFSLFLSLFGLEITKLFTTGKIYFDAYKLIPVFSLGIIFGMLKDVSVTGLQITKKTKVIGIALTGIAIVNLILNIVLVPIWGVYGASLSSVISQLIFFLLMFHFAQKSFKIPYRLDKIGIIIIAGATLFLAGSTINNAELVVRILVKTIALLLFPLTLFIMKVIDKSEIAMMTSVINRIKGVFMQGQKEELVQSISESEDEKIKAD